MEILMAVLEAAAYERTVHLPQADREHPLLRWRREHALAPPEMASMPRDWVEWLAVEDVRLGRSPGTPADYSVGPGGTRPTKR